MPDDITQKQPHLVVNDRNGKAHVISLHLIRQVANGQHIPDNELTRVLAVVLLDNIEDEL